MYEQLRHYVCLGSRRLQYLCGMAKLPFFLYDFAVFLEDQSDAANKSFFSEIISSISDVKFSHDGNYFLARDYLTIKVSALDPAPV